MMVACGSTMMQDLEKSKREYAPLPLSEMFWDVLFRCHQGGGCHPSHVVPCHHNCHDHQQSWRLPHTCPLHSIEAIWTSTQTPVYTPNCPTNSEEILVLPFMHIGKYNFCLRSILNSHESYDIFSRIWVFYHWKIHCMCHLSLNDSSIWFSLWAIWEKLNSPWWLHLCIHKPV